MAEDRPEEKRPPKISLSGSSDDSKKEEAPKPDEVPEELVKAPDSTDAPPTVRPVGETQKYDTSRVEVPQGIPATPKSETTRISISGDDLEDDKRGTGGKTPPVTVSAKGIPSKAKKETTKVDVSEIQPIDQMAEVDPRAHTVPVAIPSAPKSQTTKIDVAHAETAEVAKDTSLVEDESEKKESDQAEKDITKSLEDAYRAASKATMRIEIDESTAPPETGKIEVPEQKSQDTILNIKPERTTRVDLSEVLGEKEDGQDVFKRRPGDTVKSTPKTIKIKKADMAPTVVMKKSPQSQAPTVAPKQGEASKSGTARIELPGGGDAAASPPSQRKTIRIKRPDAASGAKPITIARAAGTKPPGAPAVPQVPTEGVTGAPGVTFSIIAGLSIIVAGVLIYVLTAQIESIGMQKDTPSKPFPGRLL